MVNVNQRCSAVRKQYWLTSRIASSPTVTSGDHLLPTTQDVLRLTHGQDAEAVTNLEACAPARMQWPNEYSKLSRTGKGSESFRDRIYKCIVAPGLTTCFAEFGRRERQRARRLTAREFRKKPDRAQLNNRHNLTSRISEFKLGL
jgi:hypothetical protein